jgi:hypothetical protein
MPNPLNRAVDMAGDAVRKIIAYHGSPHDFNKFDARKIGGGEGHQAFGYGLYFAEHPDTAEHYRKSLTGGDVDTPESYAQRVWRHMYSEHSSPDEARARAIEAIKDSMGQPGNMNPSSQEVGGGAIEYLSRQSGPPPAESRLGRVYEVEIAHPESDFLDLNSRVWTQPRRVQDALRSLIGSSAGDMGGKKAYREVSRAYGDGLSDVAASKVLLGEGVPGLKYRDAMSRGSASNATRNYVMFPGTEDSITILRKYGLLPAVGVGAASAGSAMQNPAQDSQ